MKKLVLAIALLMTSCTTSNQEESNVDRAEQVTKLIETGCSNLPNLHRLREDQRPSIEVWQVSTEAFGELSRIDSRYLNVAAALTRLSNLIDPVNDGFDDISIVNAFCSGIGGLTN